MYKASERIFAAALVGIPGVLVTYAFHRLSRENYYHLPQLIWGLTFAGISIIKVWIGYGLKTPQISREWYSLLSRSLSIAWTISLVVFFLINLTPICIGQNNGDGFNDAGLCMFYSGLAIIVFNIPVVLINELYSMLFALPFLFLRPIIDEPMTVSRTLKISFHFGSLIFLVLQVLELFSGRSPNLKSFILQYTFCVVGVFLIYGSFVRFFWNRRAKRLLRAKNITTNSSAERGGVI